MRLPLIAVIAASASTTLAVTQASCPEGWAPFTQLADDRVASSCIAAVPFLNDGSSTLDDTCAAFHAGAHAASVSGGPSTSGQSGLVSMLSSVVSSDDAEAVLGCVASQHMSDKGERVTEWSWSDGTDSDNLDVDSSESLWGQAWSANSGSALETQLRYVMSRIGVNVCDLGVGWGSIC